MAEKKKVNTLHELADKLNAKIVVTRYPNSDDSNYRWFCRLEKWQKLIYRGQATVISAGRGQTAEEAIIDYVENLWSETIVLVDASKPPRRWKRFKVPNNLTT